MGQVLIDREDNPEKVKISQRGRLLCLISKCHDAPIYTMKTGGVASHYQCSVCDNTSPLRRVGSGSMTPHLIPYINIKIHNDVDVACWIESWTGLENVHVEYSWTS